MLITGAQCDKCGTRDLWGNHLDKRTIVFSLCLMGWSVEKDDRSSSEQTLCPICRKAKKEENEMSYMGVGYSGYEYETCPKCGEGMWNGRCENPDCEYHWHPKEEDDNDE